VDECRRLSRSRFLQFFAQREPATVVLEACGWAHHWGRKLREVGHAVVLLPPQYVRPYVPRNKTDRTDAKALLEAYRNADIGPVPIKSVEQQQVGALHRLRSGWLATRTGLNTLRGILRELGWFIPLGAQNVVPQVQELVEDPDSGLPEALRPALFEACWENRELEARIRDVELQLQALSAPARGFLHGRERVGSIDRPETRVRSRPTATRRRLLLLVVRPQLSLRPPRPLGVSISENDALDCPRTRSLRGGRYLTPPEKSSLTGGRPDRRLWKLPELTGLWTCFEVDSEGHKPTAPWKTVPVFHSSHSPFLLALA